MCSNDGKDKPLTREVESLDLKMAAMPSPLLEGRETFEWNNHEE